LLPFSNTRPAPRRPPAPCGRALSDHATFAPQASPATKNRKLDSPVGDHGGQDVARAGTRPISPVDGEIVRGEPRLVALIADLVSEEAESGRLTAAVPLDDLPYVLVRIMEPPGAAS
jgi:hypothetical protein